VAGALLIMELMMPDNKSIRSPHDDKRIDVNDPAEVANWTKGRTL
jgi:hypothetical protein